MGFYIASVYHLPPREVFWSLTRNSSLLCQSQSLKKVKHSSVCWILLRCKHRLAKCKLIHSQEVCIEQLFIYSFIFYWRIITLQKFAVFCQTLTWISHKYTYFPFPLNSFWRPFSVTVFKHFLFLWVFGMLLVEQSCFQQEVYLKGQDAEQIKPFMLKLEKHNHNLPPPIPCH